MQVSEPSINEFVVKFFNSTHPDNPWCMYNNLPVCVDVIDIAGHFHYVNERCADFYGLKKEELCNKTVVDIAINGAQGSELLAHLKWVAEDRPQAVPYIGLKKTIPGKIVYVRIDWDYIMFESIVLGFISVITDLSHKMPDIMRYRANEVVVSSMIQTLLCGVMIISADGTILEVNSISERILLKPRGKIIGTNFTDLMSLSQSGSEDLWLNFQWSKYARMNEYTLMTEQGDVRYILIESASAITYKSISSLLVFVKDITDERIRADELALNKRKLERSYRKNMFKEMVSGIAHEMNQPLSAIANYATGCVRRLSEENIDPEIFNILTMITRQSTRASNIIHNLKTISGGYGSSFENVELKSIITDSIKIIEFDITHAKIFLEQKMTRQSMLVNICAIEIEQVMVNLIRNSIDALQSMSSNPDHTAKILIEAKKPAADRVEICISDTGPGIPQDIINRLFEPFYTTKEYGMGMGLALCENIIADHHGHIYHVAGKHGYTTTFVIELPIKG